MYTGYMKQFYKLDKFIWLNLDREKSLYIIVINAIMLTVGNTEIFVCLRMYYNGNDFFLLKHIM